MNVSFPSPGCYRRVQGVRLVAQGEHTVAITDYPLRVIRLNTSMARILALCATEQTCTQLAQQLHMPVKRVEALCDQLRWKNLLEMGALLPPEQWPRVSILIPSYNRAKELERCLMSLFVLEYPLTCLEIVVVDDGSTDETPVMLRQLSARYPHLRVVTHQSRQGVGMSRNSGAAAARYELHAYIDSDCVATPQWLAQLVPAFQDQRLAAVGGMIRAFDCHSVIGRYEDVRSSLYMGARPQQVRPEGPLTYLPTANLLVRRSMWRHLGGFAALSQGEDVDFCRRLLETGATIHYLPDGVVYHDYRTNLATFLAIRAAYASAEAVLLQRHPHERRILLMPPEQATFMIAVMSALWAIMGLVFSTFFRRGGGGRRRGEGAPRGGRWRGFCCPVGGFNHPNGHPRGPTPRAPSPPHHHPRPYENGRFLYAIILLVAFLCALIVTVGGTRNRLRKVRAQQVPLGAMLVYKATLRGHLAYTYHFCRHMARYYTLPLLIVGVLLPPLLLMPLLFSLIVVLVDYVRLKPAMSFVSYACCAVLDDCAYEVGVVRGCIRHKTWKPLVPVLKTR